MDPMLQRHCARYIYAVPNGLRELLTDISREVLRTQPEDTCTFIADYLDALLITRENARVSAKFVQQVSEESETIVDLLKRTGMDREQANRTATIIQGAFRTWSDRKGILKEDEDNLIAKILEDADISEAQIHTAAVVIQHAFKAYKTRKEREQQMLSGIIDWRVAARSTIKLYRRTGVSPEEAKRAANLIKAAYKGFYTRRAMRQLNEEASGGAAEEEQDSDEDEASVVSPDREDRRSKGVRIDFHTTIPHVDFGDEELISRDVPSAVEVSTVQDVKKKGKDQTDGEYAGTLLEEILVSVVGTEGLLEAPLIIEDKDSDIMDDFIPPSVADGEEPLYNRAVPLPLVSQEELEEELDAARQEMIELTEQKQSLVPGDSLQQESRLSAGKFARLSDPSSEEAEKTSRRSSAQQETVTQSQTVQEETASQHTVEPIEEETAEELTEIAAEPPQEEATESSTPQEPPETTEEAPVDESPEPEPEVEKVEEEGVTEETPVTEE